MVLMKANHDADVIVIGSGITGGWAAKELTEQGFSVLVLDRGRYIEHGRDYLGEHMPPWKVPDGGRPLRELYLEQYPIQSQCYAFNETTRHFWNNDRDNPYVMDPEKPFNWIRAGVIGGKSLLWGRQVYRWSDLDFEANKRDGHGIDWPIRYRDLAPWYSHVERFVGVSGQKEGLAQLPDGEFLPPMDMFAVEKMAKQAIEHAFPGRRLTIGRVANLTQPHEGRAACHYCGICHRGCSAGAYFCSLSSTLPAAKKTGLMKLQADAVVEGLDYDPKSRRVTGVRVIHAQTRARTTYRARMVFLCASTIGSAQILLNSRSESFPTGLANRSGVLGRYLMDHWYRVQATGVIPGFEKSYYEGLRPNGVYLARFRNLVGQDPDADFVRGYGYQGGATRMEWPRVSAATPGFGAPFKQALRQPGPWQFSLGAFGECLPNRDNMMSLDEKRVDRFGIPLVKFDFRWGENERKGKADALRQAQGMLHAMGAEQITALDHNSPGGHCIHEMGTARMGADPAQSVLNEWNQAHDVPNLYVTDGASMASSSCVNPSITFMALTARAVSHAAAQLKTNPT